MKSILPYRALETRKGELAAGLSRLRGWGVSLRAPRCFNSTLDAKHYEAAIFRNPALGNPRLEVESLSMSQNHDLIPT